MGRRIAGERLGNQSAVGRHSVRLETRKRERFTDGLKMIRLCLDGG